MDRRIQEYNDKVSALRTAVSNVQEAARNVLAAVENRDLASMYKGVAGLAQLLPELEDADARLNNGNDMNRHGRLPAMEVFQVVSFVIWEGPCPRRNLLEEAGLLPIWQKYGLSIDDDDNVYDPS